MNYFKRISAAVAVAAMLAATSSLVAQDDLDDLLADLEGETAGVAAAPAEEAPAAAEEEPAATAEEPAADEPAEAADEEPAATAEEPADEADEPVVTAEEPSADEPADEEEPAAEPSDTEVKGLLSAIAEAGGEEAPAAEEPVAAEAPAKVADVPPAPKAPSAKSKFSGPDAELLANIDATEKVRRQAFDMQAKREILEARTAMGAKDYLEAVRHYRIASKLLNDSASSASLRKECLQGIAEGYYQAAFDEYSIGRKKKAIEYMDKALLVRHPKARRQLEVWKNEGDPTLTVVDVTDIAHRRNEQDYKELRTANSQHLRRARQLLSTRELDRAIDEVELVLVSDPYNQEAHSLRERIEKKRRTILAQERKSAREGMIADVDKAWRPAYAVNAQEITDTGSETLKKNLDEDPERAREQAIYKRMKEMRLPSISFKPPANIIDAVEFFRTASKDYDRPDIPLEQRGFNFFLKLPDALATQAAPAEEESSGFGDDGETPVGNTLEGVPVIPMITASDISFFDALTLVCQSVRYKFKVEGPMVVVMHEDASTDVMITRNYPVISAFMDKMGTASEDLKEMKSQGWGGGSKKAEEEEESQEKDWKEFFTLLGVKWPEGSSIMYIKTIGRLRVRNTYENLAELEKALQDLNAQPQLVEIETRFVEVCQDDLNSLGFEWLLNSDYSLNLGKHVSRALNLKPGRWGSNSGSSSYTSTTSANRVDAYGNITNDPLADRTDSLSYTSSQTATQWGSGNSWARNYGNYAGGHKTVGINAIDGANYSTGQRYLSTTSNHISGESKSTNDQFMRVNAFIGNADLSMILHMLSQRSDTDLLSAPKVVTKNNQEAVIKVVTEYIYPQDYEVQLQSSNSSGGSNSSSQSAVLAIVEPQNFTMREVGVILTATPELTDDSKLIDLKLDAQVVDEPTWHNYGMRIPFTGNSSSLENFEGFGQIIEALTGAVTTLGGTLSDTTRELLLGEITDSGIAALQNLSEDSTIQYYDAPMEQPFFHVRSINSSVTVFPGATIVMGGLITEQRKAMDDKIPFLGDLPFIGRLFRSHSEQTSKRNLLIFVTTRLVDVRGREVTVTAVEENDDNVKAAPASED